MLLKTAVLYVVLGLAATPAARAQHEQAKDHEHAAEHPGEAARIHGGSVTMTHGHHFEVLFTADEVRLYVYDGDQKPINEMKDVEVTVTLKQEGKDPGEREMAYVGPEEEAGRSQGYYAASYGFEKLDPEEMEAAFEVSGLGKDPIRLETTVGVSDPVTYACSMHPGVTGEDPVACSKCGMALTPQAQSDEEHEMKEHGNDEDHH